MHCCVYICMYVYVSMKEKERERVREKVREKKSDWKKVKSKEGTTLIQSILLAKKNTKESKQSTSMGVHSM